MILVNKQSVDDPCLVKSIDAPTVDDSTEIEMDLIAAVRQLYTRREEPLKRVTTATPLAAGRLSMAR